MKFSKISRKVLAYACATAMVFSSVSAYQVLQVSAYEESDYTAIGDDKTVTVGDWTLYAGKWGSNTGEMAYAGSTVDDLSLKVISSDGNSGCWKLQAKHTVTGLTKDTTYDLKLKVKSSQAGILYEKIETPETIKTGIEIKEGENEVTVQFKATSESTVMVLELSGIPSGTVLDFGGITCTEATEIETTTEQQADEEGYYSSAKSQWTTSLPWQVFTVGNMKYKGTVTKNTVTADFKFLAAGGGDWNTQARIPADKQVFGPLEASGDGVNYKVKVAYTSTATFGVNLQLNGENNDITFEEGTHELSLDYVSKADYPVIFMNLGNAVADSQLTFTMTFTKEGETESQTEEVSETESKTEEVSETESQTKTTSEEDDSEYASLEYNEILNNDNSEFDQALKGCKYAVVKGALTTYQFEGEGFGTLCLIPQGLGAGNFKATVNGKEVETQGTIAKIKPAVDYLTYKYNVVNISSDDGEVIVIVMNPNKKGTYKPETPVETTTESVETTTENTETTAKAPETTKEAETTTKADDTTKATDATTKATDATTITTLVTPTTAPATTVAPAKVTVKKVAVKKATKKKSAKKASIELKKVSGAAGYQVKVSTSKKFAKKTTVTVDAKSVKVTVKKLKAGKTYYVKARAYKKVSGSKIYGKWSKAVKIKNK